jgi:hypothetical protein
MTPPAPQLRQPGRFLVRPVPAERPKRRAGLARYWRLLCVATLCVAGLSLLISYATVRRAPVVYLTSNQGPPKPLFEPERMISAAPRAGFVSLLIIGIPIALWLLNVAHARAALLNHAKARRTLSRRCHRCRYPLPSPASSTTNPTLCPECGTAAPDFLTYRRARLPVVQTAFIPKDRPNVPQLDRFLTPTDRRTCILLGRMTGLPWLLFALAMLGFAGLFTLILCTPLSSITIGSAVFTGFVWLLILMGIDSTWSKTRTTFALNRFYSPPPPTSPTTPNTSSPQ